MNKLPKMLIKDMFICRYCSTYDELGSSLSFICFKLRIYS